jgi:cell division protease FtsH
VNQTLRTLAAWLLVFVVVMYLVNEMQRGAGKPDAWTYSRFMTQVEAGAVKAVTLLPEERLVTGRTVQGSEFSLTAPDDPNLTRSLLDRKVDVAAQPPKRPSVLMQLLVNFGPIVLLIVWFFFMMRQAQSGGSGAMAFGKSRARLVTAGQQKVTFVDVAGVEEAKEELLEIVDYLKDPKKYQSLGGKIPKGVILLGPPGTGKTLLAKAVAGEAGVPFFSISGSDFVEMFVGVGAARVRDLFEQGKKHAPCIIFVDEIDAVGRHRGAGLGGGHDEREQTLNALLVEMDGFNTNSGVILMAATNRPDVLDPALLRPGRFDRQVVVDRPDLNGREAILKVHVKNVKLAPAVDLSVIARRTPGFSGADLANLVNEAALLAARRNKKAVEDAELEEAIDRVMAGPERRTRVISDKEKRIVAFHECGHAIVAKKTDPRNPVHKVSIIPRGHAALGYTLQLPTEDRFLSSKKDLLNQVATMLGGRAAEEIVFGDITTGAGNDLERATALVRAMVTEYGMSEKLGTVTFGRKGDMVFIGRDLMKEKNYSERSAEMIDAEVKRLVEGEHERARAILRRNKRQLRTMAEALLDRELLDGEEVEALLSGKRLKPRPKGPKSAAPTAPPPSAPAPAIEGAPALKPQPANTRTRRRSGPLG